MRNTRFVTPLVALAAVLLMPPAAVAGQSVGVLVTAHGGDDAWNASVASALEPLRSEIPLALAFGMADRATLAAGLDSLRTKGADRVAVVRMFLSGDSFRDQTDYLLGLSDAPPYMYMHHGADGHVMVPSHTLRRATHEDWVQFEAGAAQGGGDHGSGDLGPAAGAGDGAGAGAEHHPQGTLTMLPPPIELYGVQVATHDEGVKDWSGLGPILAERASAQSLDASRERVLVLAHGMGDETENQAVLDDLAEAARELSAMGFATVRAETLREDWPEARALAEARIHTFMRDAEAAGESVIVVPFRLSGFGPYAKVLEGFDYRAADGLLPHPSLTDWVMERATAIARAQRWDRIAGR